MLHPPDQQIRQRQTGACGKTFDPPNTPKMKNIDKVENSFGFGCSRDPLWSPVERSR